MKPEDYLEKLGNMMTEATSEIEQNKIPKYKIELMLTPDQIIKVIRALHPEPYEIGRLTKDHKS